MREPLAAFAGILAGIWTTGVLFHLVPVPRVGIDDMVWWYIPWFFTAIASGLCVGAFVIAKAWPKSGS